MNIEASSNRNVATLPGLPHGEPKPALRPAAVRARVAEMLESGVTLKRIAVEARTPFLLLDRWHKGEEMPSVMEALALWLSELDLEVSALSGDFVETPTARRIIKAFEQARLDKNGKGQRGIALIYGASGIGKSETAAYYQTKENHARDYGAWPVITVRAEGGESFAALLLKIVDTMEEMGAVHYGGMKPVEVISQRIPSGGLLIIDEAQLLARRRMDELRIFPDMHGIAIAFMGNMAGYKSLEAAKIGQIASRVGGARVIVDMPTEDDVDALLDAWDIRGRKVRELALMIGLQDGGLRYLSDTARTAKTYAKANGKPVDERLFKAAAVSCGAWGGIQ